MWQACSAILGLSTKPRCVGRGGVVVGCSLSLAATTSAVPLSPLPLSSLIPSEDDGDSGDTVGGGESRLKTKLPPAGPNGSAAAAAADVAAAAAPAAWTGSVARNGEGPYSKSP